MASLTGEQDHRSVNSAAGEGQELIHALEEFVAMLDSHLEQADKPALKQLLTMANERRECSVKVRMLLDSFMHDVERNGGRKAETDDILRMITRIQSKESVLSAMFEKSKQECQASLGSMRKGKQALQGYSINNGLAARPKYLSNRM